MSTTERASRAGYARAAKMTAEQRRESARRAYLAGAVNAVVARAPELSADQVARLRAVFAPAVNG
jgi:enoyl-CoA hydratase/carnithine racemase